VFAAGQAPRKSVLTSLIGGQRLTALLAIEPRRAAHHRLDLPRKDGRALLVLKTKLEPTGTVTFTPKMKNTKIFARSFFWA